MDRGTTSHELFNVFGPMLVPHTATSEYFIVLVVLFISNLSDEDDLSSHRQRIKAETKVFTLLYTEIYALSLPIPHSELFGPEHFGLDSW